MPKHFFLFTLLIALCCNSCSSDSVADVPDNTLLKSRKQLYTGWTLDDEYYQYSNGFLTQASGFSYYEGDYTYDTSGKLLTKTTQDAVFTYEYDSLGRLEKEIQNSPNCYTTLSYEVNKVIQEKHGIRGLNEIFVEKKEMFLDVNGTVVKTNTIYDYPAISEIKSVEYTYDNSGNITKKTFSFYGTSMTLDTDYTYENTRNPYYISFNKFLKATRYLDFSPTRTLHNWNGLSPNMIHEMDSSYEVNGQSYPTIQNQHGINIAYDYY